MVRASLFLVEFRNSFFFPGADNPNFNRLTWLTIHGDHFHSKGSLSPTFTSSVYFFSQTSSKV